MPDATADELGQQLRYEAVEVKEGNADPKPATHGHRSSGKVACVFVTFGAAMAGMLGIVDIAWPRARQQAVPLRNLNGTAPASMCKEGVPGKDIPNWGCDSFAQKQIQCRRKCLVDCSSICAQCFPSSATVSVLLEEQPCCHRSTAMVVERRMDQLQVGDLVLTASGFSKIFAFMDHKNDAQVEVLSILTATGKEVSLTANHIIFAHMDQQPVLAGSIAVGDLLWQGTWEGAQAVDMMPTAVVQVSRRPSRGMHAPLTEEGSMLVNGMLASSYASVETLRWGSWPLLTGHDAARFVHKPLQWWCTLLPSACGPSWHTDALGRHAFTQFILDNFGWLQALNAEHADLRAATLGRDATAGTWAAALVQVLAGITLFLLHALLFTLTAQHVSLLAFCLAGKRMLSNVQSKFGLSV